MNALSRMRRNELRSPSTFTCAPIPEPSESDKEASMDELAKLYEELQGKCVEVKFCTNLEY